MAFVVLIDQAGIAAVAAVFAAAVAAVAPMVMSNRPWMPGQDWNRQLASSRVDCTGETRDSRLSADSARTSLAASAVDAWNTSRTYESMHVAAERLSTYLCRRGIRVHVHCRDENDSNLKECEKCRRSSLRTTSQWI